MHEHYLKGGYDNVEIRDKVNILANRQPGSLPYDLELAAVMALQQAGLRAEDLVVDVGSGRIPYFLGLLKLQGHRPERLVGVEPNIPGNELLPWLRQDDSAREISGVRIPSPRLAEGLKPNLPREAFEGINMVRGYAEELPIGEGRAKVITAFRSLYHMNQAELGMFYANVMHSLRQEGIFVASTRGHHYKENMRYTEQAVCGPLSRMMGVAIKGPEPLNAGLTSEKAREWITERFPFVWELRNRARIIIPGRFALHLVMNAHLTLTDMYEDAYGNHPSKAVHRAALYEVLKDHIKPLDTGRSAMFDTFDESVFIASETVQDIPAAGSGQMSNYTFERIK